MAEQHTPQHTLPAAAAGQDVVFIVQRLADGRTVAFIHPDAYRERRAVERATGVCWRYCPVCRTMSWHVGGICEWSGRHAAEQD